GATALELRAARALVVVEHARHLVAALALARVLGRRGRRRLVYRRRLLDGPWPRRRRRCHTRGRRGRRLVRGLRRALVGRIAGRRLAVLAGGRLVPFGRLDLGRRRRGRRRGRRGGLGRLGLRRPNTRL